MFQLRASLTEEMAVFSGKEIGGSLTFYIDVEDVEELYAVVQEKAKVVAKMHKTFYGAQEFGIEDCNGYVLVFAQTA
ncbi:MAG: hypothetical protein NVS4B7_20140 [Ktedonobacteraceae bacterium]